MYVCWGGVVLMGMEVRGCWGGLGGVRLCHWCTVTAYSLSHRFVSLDQSLWP